MKKFGKTLSAIVTVIAVLLLIIVAVLYFVDTPVVEEGQEPTLPQKLLIKGKEYLTEILAALGVSGVAVMTFLVNKIRSNSNNTLLQSQSTDAVVQGLQERVKKSEETIINLVELIVAIGQKQDIANNVLLTTFSLSDLPASLREKIANAQEQYNKLCEVKKAVEHIAEKSQNSSTAQEDAVVEEASDVYGVSEASTSGTVYD